MSKTQDTKKFGTFKFFNPNFRGKKCLETHAFDRVDTPSPICYDGQFSLISESFEQPNTAFIQISPKGKGKLFWDLNYNELADIDDKLIGKFKIKKARKTLEDNFNGGTFLANAKNGKIVFKKGAGDKVIGTAKIKNKNFFTEFKSIITDEGLALLDEKTQASLEDRGNVISNVDRVATCMDLHGFATDKYNQCMGL